MSSCWKKAALFKKYIKVIIRYQSGLNLHRPSPHTLSLLLFVTLKVSISTKQQNPILSRSEEEGDKECHVQTETIRA